MSVDNLGVRVGEVDIPVRYIRTTASTWTFQPKKVRRWVESHLEGRVLNLFAGKTQLSHEGEIIRNDKRTETDEGEPIPADCHFDAIEVRDHFADGSFDTVILDPPFSEIQSRKRYDGEHAGKFKHIRDEVADILRPGGKTLTFGYHSTGMATTRGFQKEEILLICHGGRFPDTIGTVDRRGEDPRDGNTSEQMNEAPRDTIAVAERKGTDNLKRWSS